MVEKGYFESRAKAAAAIKAGGVIVNGEALRKPSQNIPEKAVSEAQAASQTAMLQLMERRLADVSGKMQENLQGSAQRTAKSLGELQQRLQAMSFA